MLAFCSRKIFEFNNVIYIDKKNGVTVQDRFSQDRQHAYTGGKKHVYIYIYTYIYIYIERELKPRGQEEG